MVDIVMAVDDPLLWHRANMKENKHHYSSLAMAGPRFISEVQESAAGIYYNPYVELKGIKIKYGVISYRRLCHDLSHWDSLYVSGRLHKPTLLLHDCDGATMSVHQQENLHNALTTALLVLPETFSETQLYMAISSISYKGDLRMGIAENPHKVRNIVERNMAGFRSMYLPLLASSPSFQPVLAEPLPPSLTLPDTTTAHATDTLVPLYITQRKSPESVAHLLDRLPLTVKDNLRSASKYDTSSAFDSLARSSFEIQSRAVHAAIAPIVRASSRGQTVKGVFTAGLLKSLKYIAQKLAKRR
eukprot:TRINITY_DN11505_c0_g1_i3.p1 TRINITY_DN11505_c0_g1~~TRINITY_DN11505_c0_g1_i3.p1  ORF type:complete len:348 (+),score=45.84 TRINITY_DN11505_c0_g1_i3:143-1045(+)